MNFTTFPLHQRLQRALATAGYTTPTPIQAAALPVALAGNDIVGTAQTGTGKTAAFVLPILQRLLTTPCTGNGPRALILTPTRELAEQVHSMTRQLACHTNLRSATIYGGVGMALQEHALCNGTEIIVACPGRLLDHVERGSVNLNKIECVVLDEADRMLDMGFLPPVTRILSLLPRERQTMLFSATFAPELCSFVDRTLHNPQRIALGIAAPAETVEHALYPVPKHLKTALLTALLRQMTTGSVLIFTRTKHRANRVSEQLTKAGLTAAVLHGNKSQNHRQKALDDFRGGQVRLLVATDIAARGIDVSLISHVVNYDIPDCADAYIHRIGRTGRAERNGEALTFVTMEDGAILRDIERVLGERIATRTLNSFDYQQPAPHADEFQRAPLPPRTKRPAAAPAVRPQAAPSTGTDRGRAAHHTSQPAPAAAPGKHTGTRNAAPAAAATSARPRNKFARPTWAPRSAKNG